jgi:hypothetical protein
MFQQLYRADGRLCLLQGCLFVRSFCVTPSSMMIMSSSCQLSDNHTAIGHLRSRRACYDNILAAAALPAGLARPCIPTQPSLGLCTGPPGVSPSSIAYSP